jgi:hypothetical protein
MTPAMVTPGHRLPGAKEVRQRPPGTARPHDPQDAFHHQPVIARRTTQPGPRQERRDLDPMGWRQFRQARHAQGRRPRRSSCWSLPGAADDMAALRAGLMLSAKARPPQPLLPVLLRVPQSRQQSAQFGHTQSDLLVDTAPFSRSAWACARRTTSTAWASKAKVMCRYQPVQVRTSY